MDPDHGDPPSATGVDPFAVVPTPWSPSSPQPAPAPRRAALLLAASLGTLAAVLAVGMARDHRTARPRMLRTTTVSAATATPACPADMAAVPGTTFLMGERSSHGFADEQPPHPVRIDAYCIDRLEVTVAAYRACIQAGACTPATTDLPGLRCNLDLPGHGDHPVNCVDWGQSVAYCRWRGRRLPTEAEWEHAGRGGDGREYPWGNDPPGDEACWDRLQGTCPVGSHPSGASPFGLHDMAGNVREWVQDWFAPYPTAGTTPVDPVGPDTGEYRVVRGGAYFNNTRPWLRVTGRFWNEPALRLDHVGFRCAMR